MSQSPLAIYQSHLDKGELAYQWSPEAGRALLADDAGVRQER